MYKAPSSRQPSPQVRVPSETLNTHQPATQFVREDNTLQHQHESKERQEVPETLHTTLTLSQAQEQTQTITHGHKFSTFSIDAPTQETTTSHPESTTKAPIQAKRMLSTKNDPAIQRQEAPNRAGLPNRLRAGIESLSGLSMEHVNVHYNSAKPAQISALAYTQGSDIHVAPGQERHLPHEAWHVVQQAQGRVRPTLQAKGAPINDDAGLEHEADVMGAKAWSTSPAPRDLVAPRRLQMQRPVAQRVKGFEELKSADVNPAWIAAFIADNPSNEAPQEETIKTTIATALRESKDLLSTNFGPKLLALLAKTVEAAPTNAAPTTSSSASGSSSGSSGSGSSGSGSGKQQPGKSDEKKQRAQGVETFPTTAEDLESAVKSWAKPELLRLGFATAADFYLRQIKEKNIPQKKQCEAWAREIAAQKAPKKDLLAEALKLFKSKAWIDHSNIDSKTDVAKPIGETKTPLANGPGSVAFVANLITTPPKDGNLTPLLAPYEKLYNPARTGFAMVVGVNRFKSLLAKDYNIKERVSIPQVNFPLTVLAYMWDLPWNLPYEQVQGLYLQHSNIPGFPEAIQKYEREFLSGGKNAIPYGLLRGRVLESDATHGYITELNKRFTHVYIFNSDADAPSFLTQAELAGGKKPVLDQYHDVIEQDAPELIVGGYRFDSKEHGGDLQKDNPEHRLTLLANALDSGFRNLLSRVNKELIYPTEPNMAFLVAKQSALNTPDLARYKNLKKESKDQPRSWGQGKGEGVELRNNLRKFDSKLSTTYRPDLATPTASDRFRIAAPRTLAGSWEAFCAERVSAMVSEEQTYITKLAVMISKSGIPKSGKINPAWVNANITSLLCAAIENPTTIVEAKPIELAANSEKEIMDLFEKNNLIHLFIWDNRMTIVKIHGELFGQFREQQRLFPRGPDARQPNAAMQATEEEKAIAQFAGFTQPLDFANWRKSLAYREYREAVRLIGSPLPKEILEELINKIQK